VVVNTQRTKITDKAKDTSTTTTAAATTTTTTTTSAVIAPGSLVALHPGIVYLKRDVGDIDRKTMRTSDSSFIMRYDMSVIDSTSWAGCEDDGFQTDLHLGCRIPGEKTLGSANVMAIAYDFPVSFPEELNIFNRFHRPPSLSDVISVCKVQSIAYLSLREIHHQEKIVCNFIVGKWQR
jgi:hypothetical protein